MSFQLDSCKDFTTVLASAAPTPGGGAASAFAAAIGTALGNMVGSLTIGRKKYAAVEDEMIRLNERATALWQAFLELMDEDAAAFTPLAEAFKLPEDTEAARAHKADVMEGALRLAASAPMRVLERCCEAIELIEGFAEKGTIVALSDAGVGALLCKAAMQGSALNVYINTSSMRDKACAAELNARADALLAAFLPRADAAYEKVRAKYRPEEA